MESANGKELNLDQGDLSRLNCRIQGAVKAHQAVG